MSRFYASIEGSARTKATRCGTKKSGISGHIRGWNLGIRVEGSHQEFGDTFTAWLTSGSAGSKNDICLGTFTEDDLIS